MSIQDWGAVGEIVGAIGVIASLLYLALQIRQNSRTSKAEAVQAIQQAMVDLSMALASDPSWSKILESSRHSFRELSPEERTRLGFFWIALMRTTETLYHHYLNGNADPSIWEAHARGVAVNLRSRGFREWWQTVPYPFTSEFSLFVNDTMRSVQESKSPATNTGHLPTWTNLNSEPTERGYLKTVSTSGGLLGEILANPQCSAQGGFIGSKCQN